MTALYTTHGKQVLRKGEHFADAVDPGAAMLIADTLNRRGDWCVPGPAEKIKGESVLSLMQQERSFSSFTDKTLHRWHRQQDEYACTCGMRWDVFDGFGHP